jgi:hypothetical protein
MVQYPIKITKQVRTINRESFTSYSPQLFLGCFSFDDTVVSNHVVIATRTPDDHFLVERVYHIEHVAAINSPPSDRKDTALPARPFDEFPADPTGSNSSDPPKSD